MTPEPHVVRRGGGTPMLFVHGNGVDHRLLLELDDVFADVGEWERIYLDLPGFGGTPPLSGRAGLPDVADWLDGVAEDQVGLAPFAVVANSMGGLLARDLVLRRSTQCLGMALLAPVVTSDHARRTLSEREVLVEDSALLARLEAGDADAYAEMSVVQSPENWERFRRAVLPGIHAADEGAMRRIGDLYELPSHADDRLAVESPVLIVAGKQDHVVGYKDQLSLSRRFPHSTYAALDRAGHNVQIDQPDILKALLQEWARTISGKTRDAVEFRSGLTSGGRK